MRRLRKRCTFLAVSRRTEGAACLRACRRDRGVVASSVNEGVAAGAFYVALASTVGGSMILARAAVERRGSGRRLGLVLLGIGVAGIALSLLLYLSGPRRVLPF